ncbi:MAG TPA: hypothetical protein VGM43_20040 [Bryobacteraceae bacterium]
MKRTLGVLMLGASLGFVAIAAPQDATDKGDKMDSHKMDTKKMSGKMDGQKMKQKKSNGKMQKNETDSKK